MSLFRRNQPPVDSGLTAPVAELGGVCIDGYCVAQDPLEAELTDRQEALVGLMEDRANQWGERLQQSRERVSEIRDILEEASERNYLDAGLNTRARRAEMPVARANIASDMGSYRLQAQHDIQAIAGFLNNGDSIVELTMTGKLMKLAMADKMLDGYNRKHFAQTDDEAKAKGAKGISILMGEPIVNPYHRLFALEAMSRVTVAHLITDYPALAASLFAPSNLPNLPDSMQSFVATELAYDNDSLIMNFLLANQRKDVGFFDYLTGNGLAPAAKESAAAIALGASAMGGCDCPMNAFGICKTAADRIDREILPKGIRDDMDSRQKQATSRLVSELKLFSARNKVSQMWTLDAVLPTGSEPRRKPAKASKRQVAPAPQLAKLFAESLAEDIRQPAKFVTPETVEVGWKDSDGTVETAFDDDDKVERIVEQMMAGRQVSRYIREHQAQKSLPDFVRAALTTILKAESYWTEPSITRMSNMHPIKTEDKRNLAVWRLAGTSFVGSGGRAGNKTRIYFGVDHTDGVRRVELLKIAEKEDIEKRTQRGSSL